MNEKENVQLEASGWKVSSVEEFLGLTKAEAIYIDLKLALLDSYRRWREQKQVILDLLSFYHTFFYNYCKYMDILNKGGLGNIFSKSLLLTRTYWLVQLI